MDSIWCYFFNFKVNIVFNNKTTNYSCIYMELSFRSGPPQLSSKLCRIRRSTLLHWQDGGEGKKTSGKKSLKRDSLFSKLCVHKQCSQCSSSCVETLVILRAKFHVVSSLLSVLNIAILSTQRSHWKWFCPEQWKYGHLKCAAFIVIKWKFDMGTFTKRP